MRSALKIKSIDGAALAVAIVAGVVTGVICLVSAAPWWYAVAGAGVIFLAARHIVKHFVLYKIKPIYRLVTAKNISTKELRAKTRGMDDMVGRIQDELSDWTKKRSEEIVRLKENEKYRKEFLGNLSHEIRTPIFTVQGYISTLLDGALEDGEINRSYLDRAEKNIDRLINIVDDLDEISRLESGEVEMKRSVFNIAALVREIADSMEYAATLRSITVAVNPYGNESAMVYADRSHIAQVLVNLISNSIKYGVEGGRTEISLIDIFDKILVEVADDGIGIDPAHHTRIFERFYRVDRSRSREQGGTGLGLAIVKHIMEAHGEEVALRSEHGKGATFSFTLRSVGGEE